MRLSALRLHSFRSHHKIRIFVNIFRVPPHNRKSSMFVWWNIWIINCYLLQFSYDVLQWFILRKEIHSNFLFMNCIVFKCDINQEYMLIVKAHILQICVQSLYHLSEEKGSRGTDRNVKFMLPLVPYVIKSFVSNNLVSFASIYEIVAG